MTGLKIYKEYLDTPKFSGQTMRASVMQTREQAIDAAVRKFWPVPVTIGCYPSETLIGVPNPWASEIRAEFARIMAA